MVKHLTTVAAPDLQKENKYSLADLQKCHKSSYLQKCHNFAVLCCCENQLPLKNTQNSSHLCSCVAIAAMDDPVTSGRKGKLL